MKVGYVAIVGRPNVGKSTLLNNLLDFNVSITSSTPQTTRNQIKGIYNDDESQIIFLDTPGIHKPKQKLGEFLNEKSYESIKNADVVMFLQPINDEIGPGDEYVINKLKNIKDKIAVITKIDLSSEDIAKKRAQTLKSYGFDIVIGISDKFNDSITHLIEVVKEFLPEGIRLYDVEDITDLSIRFLSQELIRKAVIENTHEEIPHRVGVIIDEFIEPTENDLYKIYASIYVESDSQKIILIGKSGEKIKQIGIESRQEIERLVDGKVFLDLKVKVDKKWTNKEDRIKKMGYR